MELEVDFLLEYTPETIVAELRRVAGVTGKTCVRAADLETHGRVRYHMVVKHFGSLKKALDAAGLRSSRFIGARDEELLTLLVELWRKTLADAGRRPRVGDVAKYGLPVSAVTIVKRFGSWKKALVAASQFSQGVVCVAPPSASRSRPVIPAKKRFLVFQRDLFTCRICRHSGVPLEVDHVVPVCQGGSDRLDNLQTLCVRCNRGKGGLMEFNPPPMNADKRR